MRTLKFIVNDQIIERDPNCDFSDLVPGTDGYLRAEFSFSQAWSGYYRVAGFYSPMGKEYPARILEDGKSCMIPAEACARRTFYVKVLGKRGDDKLVTNKVAVSQNGGK